jgi:hypothetical protein
MKWLHTYGSIILAGLSIFVPVFQGLIVAHPAIAGGLAAAYAILGHLLPSPVSTPPAASVGPAGGL